MQSHPLPRQLTMPKRVLETAEILATGILRTKRRQTRDTNSISERGLDSSANSSVHSMKPGVRGEKL